jgi:hypothetical protein
MVAMAERRRRNLVQTPAFEGCRCCYDPNSDGGEYRALIDYKQEHPYDNGFLKNGENAEPNVGTTTTENNDVKLNNGCDDDSSDDEFDYLLDEDLTGGGDGNNNNNNNELKQLEEQRRLELEFQFLTRQVALQHGYGVHRQLHPIRVLKAAGLHMNNTTRSSSISRSSSQSPPAVVLHLVDPDSLTSATLDYFLETHLTQRNPGTVFLRSGGRSTLLMDADLARRALPQLNESMLPALVAIKDGVAVNVCPKLRGLTIGRDDDSAIDEYAVEQWLRQSGVLLSQAPRYMEDLCRIRPEEEALSEYMASKKPSPPELERFNCGLDSCNKAFPHEHVGIQTSEQSGLVVKEETVLGVDEEN